MTVPHLPFAVSLKAYFLGKLVGKRREGMSLLYSEEEDNKT